MRSARCICSGCGLKFGSVETFDFHRVGSYERKKRRCLTQKELIKQGFRVEDGWWTKTNAVAKKLKAAA